MNEYSLAKVQLILFYSLLFFDCIPYYNYILYIYVRVFVESYSS